MTSPRPPLPDHRAEVLAAIRRALAQAPSPARTPAPSPTPGPTPTPTPTTAPLLDTFSAAARKVGTEVFIDTPLAPLIDTLANELRAERGLPADHPLVIARPPFAEPLPPFTLDIAVIPATLGIATLGSVLLEGPRLPPMTAEITVALLPRDRLVPTLRDALLSHRPGPTRLLVTGPSKTADIEGVLITGVHGPRRFIVVVAT